MQSRPSSVYEKKHLRSPTKNECLRNSKTIEPIYEPILPPVPPPLPKKPWESEKELEPIETASELDTCTEKAKKNYVQRGPAPLQRSPVIDNVALKALSEDRNLKAREDSIAEDIVEQLSQISLLTQQHMSEQGLVQSCTNEEGEQKQKYQDSTSEKLHTLNYKSGILNSSGKKVNDTSSTMCTSVIEFNEDDSKSANVAVPECSAKENYRTNILNLNGAQAQGTIDLCDDVAKTCQNSQQDKVTGDTYTQISKIKCKNEPAQLVKVEVTPINQMPGKDVEVVEKYEHFVDALEVMSTEGQGLPYIDESRGNETIYVGDIEAGHLCTSGKIQKRILSSVEEEEPGITFPHKT